jgi:DNA replication and repair protein RecF
MAHVDRLRLRNFRNYERLELDLATGLTVVHGAVGAGKTNLLEAIYLGCVGRSCRTANERELVKFGERAVHVGVKSSNGGAGETTFEIGIEVGKPKVVNVNGAPSERLAEVEARPLLCVFMPDRLELVKGNAGVRRAHLDAFVSASWPGRRSTRLDYGRALAQRNALLSRLRAGSGTVASLSSWNTAVARHGFELMEDRNAAIDMLAPLFERHARALGLEGGATLEYRPCSKATSREALQAELAESTTKDLERGFSTHGPHRDEFRFYAKDHDLRRFGSQGQQRIALLALILAERDALAEVRNQVPILLLDDVLSELDDERRTRLLESVRRSGQTLLTTADLRSVPIDGDVSTVHVASGRIDAT